MLAGVAALGFRLQLRSRKALRREAEAGIYDVVIVGSGPAGLTAAIYAARYMMKAVVIAGDIGGQVSDAGYVENYPGILRIPGPDLVNRMLRHVQHYKVPVIMGWVNDIKKQGGVFEVYTSGGAVFKAGTVILAMGVKKRKLGVPGEDEYSGRGVSYCAPCDAPMFKDKIVGVVGGGDSAASAAVLLADYASKVYLIHRRNRLRAQPIYHKILTEHPRVQILWNKVVVRLEGDRLLRRALLRDTLRGETSILELDGLFVEIGADPPREFFERIGVATDEQGYAIVGPDQSTSVKGIFAAGDCTNACNGPKQIITAAAQGAVAADAAYSYIVSMRGSG
jgi:thioredoxin reductase (NADPH)